MINMIGKTIVGLAVAFAVLPATAQAHPHITRQSASSDTCATDNVLWIATESGGVNCLDAQGFKSYTSEKSQLTNDFVTGVTVCGKNVYAVGSDLNIYDGTNWLQPSNQHRY